MKLEEDRKNQDGVRERDRLQRKPSEKSQMDDEKSQIDDEKSQMDDKKSQMDDKKSQMGHEKSQMDDEERLGTRQHNVLSVASHLTTIA